MPPDLINIKSSARSNIFYTGQPIGFRLSSAARTYEVRDYYGNLVDSGTAGPELAITKVTQPGWYKLYVYGSQTRSTWGDVVGGTTFAIIRDDANFPKLPVAWNSAGDFATPVLTRVDPKIDLSWGSGAPAAGMTTDNFGAIWTGQIQPKYSQTYSFGLHGDDRARLTIDGKTVVDFWDGPTGGEFTGTIALQAGRRYDIKLQYAELIYDASVRLSWSSASQTREVVPTGALFADAAATTPTGLTGRYYNLLQSPDSANDQVLRSVMGMGATRLAAFYPSNTAEEIARLEKAVSIEEQLYTPYDPQRRRSIIVAFPNGTTDLAAIRTIVERFKGRVHYWECRNEPNFSHSGADFVNNELKAFYQTVKAADPNAKVMGPNPVTAGPYGLQWLENFFAAGGGNYIDAFSFHAYNNVNGSYQPRLQGRWTMLQTLLFEQYGVPKEQNAYWYDRNHGFWDFPMFWVNSDGSTNPAGVLMRNYAEAVHGTNFSRAFDFGAAKDLYVGNLYAGPGKSVAAFMSTGDTQGKVT